MAKVAIYTVLTGGYDTLEQPKVIDERFDYFCFSNDIEKDSIGVWKVRKFEGEFPSKQIESRYPKMHPYTVLPDYDYSVYMDANIRIETADFYNAVMQKIDAGVELSGVKHPFRNCSYVEGYVVFTYGLDKFSTIVKEMRFIRKEGLPRRYGMFEANIILRRHDSEKVRRQCELWWKMINTYSRRDQLSFATSFRTPTHSGNRESRSTTCSPKTRMRATARGCTWNSTSAKRTSGAKA